MLEAPLIAALNHLLARESWARAQLAPFAGQAVEFRGAPLPPLRLLVEEGARLGRAPRDLPASLVVHVAPHAPVAFLAGEAALLRAVEVEGDPAFGQAVLALFRHLRWDAEEDLSRVVGDVAAHRLAEGARAFAAWQRDAASRLAEGFADYVIDEKRLLVGRPEHAGFAERVAALRDGVERLQKRIERLG